MGTSDCVFHIDIDAFFASVEELRNPRLAGQPVAVGAGVIASCNYVARRYGLHAGMPLREARRRCPELVVLEGHYPIYRCFAEEVFALCREYAPALECHLDEAFCDMTGTDRLYGFRLEEGAAAPPRVARELKDRILSQVGLSVSLGMGRSRMIAKMASKSAKPGGLRRISPAEEDAFLRPLPVWLLPGVGPRTASVLAKLNVQTIEEMRALSRESLKAMFGQNGILLHERCRGQDTRAISRREIPRSISRETSFHQNGSHQNGGSSLEIEGMLHYLCERAANTLRKLGLKTRTVEVKLRYADHGTHPEAGASEAGAGPGGAEAVRARTLPAPTQLDGEIFDTVLSLRRSLQGERVDGTRGGRRVGLRLVGVTLSRLSPDDGTHPLELFLEDEVPASSPAGERRGDGSGADPVEEALRAVGERRRALGLCRSLDRVRDRFGYSAVVCGKSLHLLGQLPQDAYGYILRTPSLTR